MCEVRFSIFLRDYFDETSLRLIQAGHSCSQRRTSADEEVHDGGQLGGSHGDKSSRTLPPHKLASSDPL